MRTTPAAPRATERHTFADGNLPSIGQASSATQTGNMLVSVKTSEIGRCFRAKKVPIKLQLPARLRIQRIAGLQKTNGIPAAIAQAPTITSGMKEREIATTCQSSERLSSWASAPIHEKEKLPTSIHR